MLFITSHTQASLCVSKKVSPSICIAHFCVRRKPAVKPPQMRSRH